MNTPTRVSNEKQFNMAIDAYLKANLTDPVIIAKLLASRGCICAAVAVQNYINKKLTK